MPGNAMAGIVHVHWLRLLDLGSCYSPTSCESQLSALELTPPRILQSAMSSTSASAIASSSVAGSPGLSPARGPPYSAGSSPSGSPSSHGSWFPSIFHRNRSSSRNRTNGARVEETDQWESAREKISETISSLLQIAGEQALPVAAEALSVVPVPGLASAVKIVDSIHKSVGEVQTNRWASLRLTERCANLLLSIHKTVSKYGPEVAHELRPALQELERCFLDIERSLKAQASLSFLAQYAKKDEIRREIKAHNTEVGDCIQMFGLSVAMQGSILRGVLPRTSEQPGSLLLGAPAEPHPIPQQTLEPLSELGIDAHEDVMGSPPSLGETLHRVQDQENAVDRARDLEDLSRVLHTALTATSHLAVTRLLQITKKDVSAALMLVLRELERDQQRQEKRLTGESASPSPSTPPVRGLTWPMDGVPAKQVPLLHRQFLELNVEALKRTRQNTIMPDAPSVLPDAPLMRRGRSRTIRVQTPSDTDLSLMQFSDTSETPPTSVAVSPNTHNPALEPPCDELAAKTELRYRMSLSHAYHHLGANLPLWTPTPVQVGAVGYLERPSGAFRTLFNCKDPSGTSNGRITSDSIPSLDGCTIVKDRQKQRKESSGLGMRLIDKLTPSSSSEGSKRTYEISAFGETAHLIAEKVHHEYFHHLDPPKKWFRTHVDAIVDVYFPDFLREELFFGVCLTCFVRMHLTKMVHSIWNVECARSCDAGKSRWRGGASGHSISRIPCPKTRATMGVFRQTSNTRRLGDHKFQGLRRRSRVEHGSSLETSIPAG
ncbi:hypothetical protein FB45DRAFT_964499 [Roridomyces roridus]|uniref:Uncharacterized protein n=1 Tax=Roridomyces roridus TaxID=1738132 RepID=A0AAD7AXG4_9AGAR|nr:hypothetical protein FB45DRAFT_964499 [Roridomyces roridus]